MKAVMISIRPEWCEKIASGEKTVEVRKTRPKIEPPFRCYIYCTKDNTFAEKTLRGFDDNGKAIYYKENKGKVIGEFVCDRITKYECSSVGFGELATTCGTCLTYDEILNYCNGNDLYGLHITDLVLYDEPRELSEFKHECNGECERTRNGKRCNHLEIDGIGCDCLIPITKAPQSWQFCVATEPRQTAD